ncbi:MAG: arsenite methyltransferase [Deltaproteobacteria bacterium]|nr:arsenite methyltransferase [Deltaproteobacteria bacterium]
MKDLNDEEIKEAVRKTYGKIAEAEDSCACWHPSTSQNSSCCAPGVSTAPTSTAEGASARLGYSEEELKSAPIGANMGLGCGNPQAIAAIKKGETVVDLGSGGGFDCFLAARAVGKKGKVIGVDMTPEMVSKARENVIKSGFDNVEFRLGEMENLPVHDSSVDVIISNCVINLATDKEKVYSEAFRILKGGGRLAIMDIVVTAELPEKLRKNIALFTGCVAGATQMDHLKKILERVGFSKIKIKSRDESKEFIRYWVPGSKIEDYILSASIEAVKP